jgi:hypothetical protein
MEKYKLWSERKIRCDSRVINIVREECLKNRQHTVEGIPLIIHDLVGRECFELERISSHLRRKLDIQHSLNRKGGSVQEVFKIYTHDWDSINNYHKEIGRLLKLTFENPEAYFLSMVIEYLGGDKK